MTKKVWLDHHTLKELMLESGLSKKQIAADTGIDLLTFDLWIEGTIEKISAAQIGVLAQVLQTDEKCLTKNTSSEALPDTTDSNNESLVSLNSIVKLSLFTGHWEDISNILSSLDDKNIIEHDGITRELFDSLGLLTYLEDTDAKDFFQRTADMRGLSSEVDLACCYSFISAIQHFLANEPNHALTSFSQVIAKSSREWMSAIAYLGSSYIHLLEGNSKTAKFKISQGIKFFVNSFDDITSFASANFHLLDSAINPEKTYQDDFSKIQTAAVKFSIIGHRHGHLRTEMYAAYAKARHGKKDPAQRTGRYVFNNITELPPLYQFESLLLCGLMEVALKNAKAALEYFAMASDLCQNLPLLAALMDKMTAKTQKLNLDDSQKNYAT